MEYWFTKNDEGKLSLTKDSAFFRKEFIDCLKKTNAFVPAVESVSYNTTKNENGKYVLNTVVRFVDGSVCHVKNSPESGDEISVEEKEIKLSDGSVKKVATATDSAKEVGLVYAITKRSFCNAILPNGEAKDNGFINFLKSTVKKAKVQDVFDAEVSAEKEIAKKRVEEKKSEREKLLSLSETIDSLRKEIAELREGLVKNGGVCCEGA